MEELHVSIGWDPEAQAVFVPVPPSGPERTPGLLFLEGLLEAALRFGELDRLTVYEVPGGYELHLSQAPRTRGLLAELARTSTKA
ncbi:MAG: hypothetical protein C4339_06795 [Nitrososphaerota archaeon]